MGLFDNLFTTAVPSGTAVTTPSVGDEIEGIIEVAAGDKPIEVTSPAFPDWLLPACLIVVVLWIFK